MVFFQRCLGCTGVYAGPWGCVYVSNQFSYHVEIAYDHTFVSLSMAICMLQLEIEENARSEVKNLKWEMLEDENGLYSTSKFTQAERWVTVMQLLPNMDMQMTSWLWECSNEIP